MTKTIKAKYANGVITPLEPLDLPDDTVLLLRVEELESSGQPGGRAEETPQERAERIRRAVAKAYSAIIPLLTLTRCSRNRRRVQDAMIFVDSNVPMYIVGAPHPNQDRAAALIDEIIDSGEALITSVEVYQEILHRYTSIRRPQSINDAFDVIDGLVGEVLSYEMTEIRAARALLATVPGLSARDALPRGGDGHCRLQPSFQL